MAALQPSRGGVGYLLLAIPVILWVLSSFISNAIFTDLEYNKPFFAAYLNTASFVLYLLPIWRTKSDHEDKINTRQEADKLAPLSDQQTKQLARTFCLIWFASNVLGNLGLGMTSVSSMTILGGMSGLFTLIVGALGGVEHFNAMRLSAVLVSICGVVILSTGDKEISPGSKVPLPDSDPRVPRHALFGDLFALGAALTYAIYTVMLKVRCGDERRISMTTFFGHVGLNNVLFLLPILIILHYTGLEVFEIPRNSKLIASLVCNAAFTFIGDACMMAAMLRTSPLAVTLGLSVQIPLALFGDLLRGTRIGGVHVLLGAVLIVAAFLAVGILDAQPRTEPSKSSAQQSALPPSESDPLLPS